MRNKGMPEATNDMMIYKHRPLYACLHTATESYLLDVTSGHGSVAVMKWTSPATMARRVWQRRATCLAHEDMPLVGLMVTANSGFWVEMVAITWEIRVSWTTCGLISHEQDDIALAGGISFCLCCRFSGTCQRIRSASEPIANHCVSSRCRDALNRANKAFSLEDPPEFRSC